MRVPVSPHYHQHSFLSDFFDYSYHNRPEVVSLLICISLMTNDIKHHFVCLLASHVCVFFGEPPVLILCPLFNWMFVFSSLSSKSSLFILDTRLSDT